MADDRGNPKTLGAAMPVTNQAGSQEPKGQLLEAPQDTQEMDFISNSEEELLLDDGRSDSAGLAQEVEGLKLAKRTRLSGAQRRKFKWLREHGRTPEEATIECKKPLPRKDDGKGSVKRQKRPRSDNTTPEEVKKKKSKGGEGHQEAGHSSRSDQPRVPKLPFRQVAGGVRIGILHSDFPEVQLTNEQMDMIQDTILSLIVDEEQEGSIFPGFNNIYRRQGYLVLVCKNEETSAWMKAKEGQLGPWEGASLKVVPEGEIPKTVILTGYFPNSKQDPNEKILTLVQKQNQGLIATGWKVLRRNEEGNTVQLVLAVDPTAADKLGKDPWVSYKFGQLQLRLRGKSSRDGAAKDPPKGREDQGRASTSEATQQDSVETVPEKELPTVELKEGETSEEGGKGSKHFPIFQRTPRPEKRQERPKGPSNAKGEKGGKPPGARSIRRKDNPSERKGDSE